LYLKTALFVKVSFT